MTHELNKGYHCDILNTYQSYLKRMSFTIPMEIEAAKRFGYNLGIKMVRGAYMDEERKIAAKQNTESPVWDDIEGSHACYNGNLERIISSLRKHDTFFVAGHNAESVEKAVSLVEKHGLKDTGNVKFGQLRGFSDQITSRLADESFKVYKYVLFGPTEQVMPYLVRRGQESR